MSHGPGLALDVAKRFAEYWQQVDPNLGANVAKVLGNANRAANRARSPNIRLRMKTSAA